MSFVSPWLLWALPLAALPVIIHLIHRQRHRTIRWAAMLFLLDATKRMKGMAKLKQFLILAMRTIAIAGIVFLISRPLASGWLGSAGGTANDTVLVILDRSASMEDRASTSAPTKRETGFAKITEFLSKTGSDARVVFIDSTTGKPVEMDSIAGLESLEPTSTNADIPSLLENALDYTKRNQSGRTDLWIASDLQRSNWDPTSGRWEALRAAGKDLSGLRLFLLTYPERSQDNVSVRIDRVRRRKSDGKNELLIDAEIRQSGSGKRIVPLEIEIEGTRTAMTIEMQDESTRLQGHVIPIDTNLEKGWGCLTLPNDTNLSDNKAFFVFSDSPPQLTTIIAEDPSFARPVRIALESPQDRSLRYETQVLSPERAGEIDFEGSALIVWQAPLPEGIETQQLENFARGGRPILFFPPEGNSENEAFGHRWGKWSSEISKIENWRAEEGLLGRTESGTALPLGDLEIRRHRVIEGQGSVLARLGNGQGLLKRSTKDPVFFVGTSVQDSYSDLARQGVSLYIILHRALAQGSRLLGDARSRYCIADDRDWKRIAGGQNPAAPGVFAIEDRLVAFNRHPSEEDTKVVDDDTLKELLNGFDYERIDDEAGSETSIASEIWRVFLLLIALALILEAVLCLPSKQSVPKQV